MAAAGRGKRLIRLAGSKGAILDRLRRAPHTVDELADALGITGNAVRLHLAALDRDGFVRPGGIRKTARRPSRTYRLAPGGESLFCQGYAPFLDQVLHAMRATFSAEEIDRVLEAVGRRLAGGRANGALPARVQAAASVLDELGGVTKVTRRANGVVTFTIRGLSCPLDNIARNHDDACRAVETMVAEMTGAPAAQRCERGADPPQCVIEVSAPAR